jgi:hypothetical protein
MDQTEGIYMTYTKLLLAFSMLCMGSSNVNAASGSQDLLKQKVEKILRSFEGIQDYFASSYNGVAASGAYFEINVCRDSKGKLYINLGRRRSTGWFTCPEMMICDSQLFVDVLGPLLKLMTQEFGTSVHRIALDGFQLIDMDMTHESNSDLHDTLTKHENALVQWIAEQNQEDSDITLLLQGGDIEVLTPGETRSKESEGRWVTDGVGFGATTRYVRHDPLAFVARITVKDGEFNLLDYNCGRFLHPGEFISLREDPQTGALRNWNRSLQTKGILIVFGLVLLYCLNSYFVVDCPC